MTTVGWSVGWLVWWLPQVDLECDSCDGKLDLEVIGERLQLPAVRDALAKGVNKLLRWVGEPNSKVGAHTNNQRGHSNAGDGAAVVVTKTWSLANCLAVCRQRDVASRVLPGPPHSPSLSLPPVGPLSLTLSLPRSFCLCWTRCWASSTT
jgi:hypothetical protein